MKQLNFYLFNISWYYILKFSVSITTAQFVLKYKLKLGVKVKIIIDALYLDNYPYEKLALYTNSNNIVSEIFKPI